MKWPTATVWRCHQCRKGLQVSGQWRLNCPVCGGRYLVPVPPGGLRLLDRWRLWRHTGLPPWTRHVPDSECFDPNPQ
jgi:DNA-directed RNA polymerase subunit RPC12/RpoP